jgi:adenine specific DNA methylase Mod
MTKEEKFYKALQDVFIGAKIEGEGGFINLMRIKSRYYSQIEKLLKEDIEKALEKYPKFRDELFDKLYDFFSRYFTESGSIYFNSTPFHNNVYEKVYTDERDVILFWKTHMLYYVKTDTIFRSMPVEFDGLKFYFDASKIENKKANEKRNIVFELNEVREDNTIIFGVKYSERGTKTKEDEILKAIRKKGIPITEEQLERAFRTFEKQNEVDFFINKNAKAFLQEQFKLWSYQYFWEGAKEWSADRVNELQILKDIAFKIIDFIAQFENELVKIWNKPKFVRKSNYVITLDRIKDVNLVEKILNHSNISEQIKEWQELGIVDESFNIEDVLETNSEGKHLSKEYEHLPIDTKYFKDLELEILSQFDDLDKSLDGWLIKSENYQALNTILPKFKEKVQTIYIDPPFNKENDAGYFYNVKYKDSSWITLLENRLQLARYLLNEIGSISVRCDYNGNMYVRLLMNEIFGEENFRNEISVRRFKKNAMEKEVKKLPEGLDTIYLYSVSENFLYINPYKLKLEERKGFWRHMGDSSGQGTPKSFFGKVLEPPKGKHWKYSQEKINQLIEEGKIILQCRNCGYIHDKTKGLWNKCPKCGADDPIPKYWVEEQTEEVLDSNWSDIYGYSTSWNFPTENSETLLKRVIESASNEGDLVMDFFIGSGTTTAVSHKLKRKWIGVEMGEHFYRFETDKGPSGIMVRMKEVLAGRGNHEPCGISKEIGWQGGGFFKYYELEQYEEALANCKYEDSDLFNTPGKSPYQEYIFLKDEKMLRALEIDYENNKVKVDLSKLYPDIDIAETLSNLTGKWIKKIRDREVEFEDGTRINIKDLDYKLIKPLIWWE